MAEVARLAAMKSCESVRQAGRGFLAGILARRSRIISSKRGATALEYGLVLPVLMLLTLGIIDVGRLMWVYNSLFRTISAAARCASIDSSRCSTSSQIQTYAAAGAWGMTIPASTFKVTYPSCGVQVSANYSFTFSTPGIGSITLMPSACVKVLHE
jgi:Flp pilus assembly protein TadG